MRIDIICKVIDNFGDAGFCLRLARALVGRKHEVRLFHDSPEAFMRLSPAPQPSGLELIDARATTFEVPAHPQPDLIIEPFGTSSEHTANRFDLLLKRQFHSVPWLVVDYLSAEHWVRGFHLSQSVEPATGHSSTYFYPGFGTGTGGLIHADLDAKHRSDKELLSKPHCEGLRFFVFGYEDAPVAELLKACSSKDRLSVAASSTFEAPDDERITRLPFVRQTDFDELLAEHDVLFVRGEDSFVRAQLLGKPFVWQIYPTSDFEHLHKLNSFLDIYLDDCEATLSGAIRRAWMAWNASAEHCDFTAAWIELMQHKVAFEIHAKRWKTLLLEGPELVSEILTWQLSTTPTLPK